MHYTQNRSFEELLDFVGMTAPQLARLIGVSRSCVYHWACGRHAPNPAKYRQIALAMRVTVADIKTAFERN